MGKKHDAVDDLTDRVEVLEEAVFPSAGNIEAVSLRAERDYWRRVALAFLIESQRAD